MSTLLRQMWSLQVIDWYTIGTTTQSMLLGTSWSGQTGFTRRIWASLSLCLDVDQLFIICTRVFCISQYVQEKINHCRFQYTVNLYISVKVSASILLVKRHVTVADKRCLFHHLRSLHTYPLHLRILVYSFLEKRRKEKTFIYLNTFWFLNCTKRRGTY
jgi:hypothetical protein